MHDELKLDKSLITESSIIASSQYNFQIELIKKVGSVDGNKS